jgi:uncharacterized protein (DUF952 family)
MNSDPIFHVADQRTWAAATTAYRPGGFEVEGFIHCSTASQVLKVLRRLFPGRRDLVLLRIDPRLLGSEVWFENLEGGDELFPHIYGELDLDAVTGIEALAIGDDGEFAMPGLLIPARSMTRGEQLH